jgi:hypothetical protein
MGEPLKKVVPFPFGDVQDIPKALRTLADQIEAGDHGDAHNLAWVIDRGDKDLALGVLGPCAEIGPTAYLLFGMAMRRMDS